MRDYASIAEALRCCRYASERGCAECPYRLNNNEKCAHLLNDAADAIEELLAKVPHWISVEERLPENGKFVLVSDGDDIDTACRYKALTPDEVETFFWDSVLEVTHWMPLPEPPKEDHK